MINSENKRELSELEKRLAEEILKIKEPDSDVEAVARSRQNSLAKVPGSLGRLEEISIRLAGITGKPQGNTADKQAIVIMCGDSGVVEEGVASAPQTVTLMQTINFTKGITGVSSQTKFFGIDLLVVDVGVKLPIPAEFLTEKMLERGLANKVVNRRIASGTRNMIKEPAMTKEEALRAILTGIEAAEAVKQAGKNILGIGEMGIGNSTAAANLICRFTGTSPEEVVGRGGGLSDEGLEKKINVVREVLEKYLSSDPIEIAASMSCFEICAMAGAYIGGAARQIPMVVDGYISVAAALLACEIAPMTGKYLFMSHRSQEPGYAAAVKKLGIEPFFDLEMKLGEASGCPIAFKIMEAACAVMNGMATLKEGEIDSAYLEDLMEKGML